MSLTPGDRNILSLGPKQSKSERGDRARRV